MDIRGCYDKAVELLARRPHFARRLEEKLAARGFSPREIEACLARLTDQALVDDRRTAAEFVDSRLRRGPIGRRRMRFELAKRGAPEQVVDELLELTYADGDLEATRSVAAAWLKRGRDDCAALGRHLNSKGFSTASILRVIEEVRSRKGEEGSD